MANIKYNKGKKNFLQGNIDVENDTIKVALVTSSYTPNEDTHEYFSDVTNEVTGTGYTTGGITVAGIALNEDTTNHEVEITCTDPEWTSSTITARGAVFYKSTGTTSTSPLICYLDFGSDQSVSSGTFTIDLGSEGFYKLG